MIKVTQLKSGILALGIGGFFLFAQSAPEEKILPAVPVNPAVPPKKNLDVLAMAALEHPVPGKVEIEYPRHEDLIQDTQVDLYFKTSGGTIPPEAQTVHVFVNNRPPIIHKDLRKPVTLQNLPEGAVVVRALVTDDAGSAYPLPDSYAMVRFFIKRKDLRNAIPPTQPYLTLNLPVADSITTDSNDHLVMEFFVHQGEIGKNLRVRYILNDNPVEIKKDGKVILQKIKSGKYHLRVELLHEDGSAMLGTFSFAERDFEVMRVLKPLPLTTPNQNTGIVPEMPD